MKINAYYQTIQDLEKAEEPFKSVTIIFDRLYLKGPDGNKPLEAASFKNAVAISCIRTVAEKLASSPVSYICRLKSLWASLKNPHNVITNTFQDYSVPYEYHLGTIFGGVYYVFVMQKTVDDEMIDLLDNFVSTHAAAVPYFNVFKDAAKAKQKDNKLVSGKGHSPQEMSALRKQFIKNLNTNPSGIDSIDWADATIGFDKKVMEEIFWGMEDDKLLKTIVSAIISTWNRLVKEKDSRCMMNAPSTPTLSMAASIDPWKFGGLTKDTINKFFDDLWVERNARNVYSSAAIGTKNTIRKKTLHSDSSQQNINAVDLELMESLKVRVEELEKDKKQWDADRKEWKAEKKELNAHILSLENKSGWVDCFDIFLHPSLNAQAIADALKKISSPHLPKSERSYWWVFYVSLLEINWILDSAKHNTILKWVNLHFKMGWDWRSDQLFKFTIEDKYKVKDSSKWEELGTTGKYYAELSKRMKDTFVKNYEGKLFDRKKYVLDESNSPNGKVTKQ